jgi:dephospho-CoA kinase
MLHNKLKVIGLTGGSGAGKGEVSSCFLSASIKSLDTDKVSRSVCEPGKPCLEKLVERFGKEIIREDGTLDRKALAYLVFNEPDENLRREKLADLNRITHHYIIEEITKWLESRYEAGDTLVVVDAPQLFESGFDKNCDYIIGVIAEPEVRIRRIIARDGISRESAQKRLASQKSDEFFVQNCDFIVYNNAGLDALEGQVNNILDKLDYAR